jgi:hypothetical protein
MNIIKNLESMGVDALIHLYTFYINNISKKNNFFHAKKYTYLI